MNIDEHFEWAPKQKRLFALSLLLGSYATQCRINWYISYTVFLVGARSMVGVFVPGCTHMHDTDTFNEAPPLNA